VKSFDRFDRIDEGFLFDEREVESRHGGRVREWVGDGTEEGLSKNKRAALEVDLWDL
jgi:hypothetical protein